MRRILPFVFLAIVLGGLGYGAFVLNKSSEKQTKPIEAIPVDAIMVWNSNNWVEVWTQLSEGNLIWDTLQTDTQVAAFSAFIGHLDSTIFTNKNHSSSFVFSLHFDGKGEWFIASNIENLEFGNLLHDSAHIFEHKSFETVDGLVKGLWDTPIGEVHGAIRENIFVLSSSPELIHQSIGQIETGHSLFDDPIFKKAWDSRGVNELANCLVHFPRLFNPVTGYLNRGPTAEIRAFRYWSDWASLDAILKVNGLLLDGWNYAQDSTSRFLRTFDKQTPIRLHCFEVLPERTAALVHFSYSDFSAWHEEYLNYLDSTGRVGHYEAGMTRLKEQGLETPSLFLDWIEGELAAGWFRPRFSRDEVHPFVLARTYNSDLAWNRLNSIAKGDSTKETYKEHTILDLGYEGLLASFFGDLYNDVNRSFVTEINSFFYFANNAEDLKELIDAYEAERTLEKNERFEILAENIYDESNMMVLARARHALPLISSIFEDEEETPLIEHREIVRGFEGIIAQVAVDQPGRYYQHVYLNYNPRFKEQVLTLWESKIDTSIRGDIHLFENHYTHRYELFLQDVNNKVYLLGSTGKVLWTKQLDGPMIGGISTVDIYNNQKYQILLNTARTVYLIDRKGRDVGEYPVRLVSRAMAQHNAVKYEGQSKYRIFVPLRNGEVINLNGEGSIVSGWEQNQGSAAITHNVQYFALNNRDYITIINEDGVLQGVGRRGKNRLTLKNPLPIADGSDYWIKPSTTIDRSTMFFADSTGNLFTQYFDNKVEKMEAPGPSIPSWFSPIDLDNDKKLEYLFADSNHITLADRQGLKLASFEFEGISTRPKVYRFDTGEKIGFSTADGLVHLIDRSGQEHPGFPYLGFGSFLIKDLNLDGIQNVVVPGQDGAILVYPLQN